MAANTVRLYNPTYQGKIDPSSFLKPKQIDDLKGKTIYMLDSLMWIWPKTWPILEQALKAKYPGVKTQVIQICRGANVAEVLEKTKKEADGAILGLSQFFPETAILVEAAADLVKAGKAVVAIVDQDYTYQWYRMATSLRVNVPIVIVPPDPEGHTLEENQTMMENSIDKIINGLRNPPGPANVIDEGSGEQYVDVKDDVDEMFAEMYRLGWTDGLPVMPPTEERIMNLVAATGKQPDEIIGRIPPLKAPATVRLLATNAAMAGCLPEYMPLVLAQARACEKMGTPLALAFNSGSVPTPMQFVNGPVRKELDINCSTSCLGPGWRSNATIGRVLGFTLRNIGGAKPRTRLNWRNAMGNPGQYTFCFGEDEENSPWEPLHVSRGFKSTDSTVTISVSTTLAQVCAYTRDCPTLIELFALSVSNASNSLITHGSSPAWFCLTPVQAAMFSKAGYTKQAVRDAIWEKSRIPKDQFPPKVVPDKLTEKDGYILVADKPAEMAVIVAGLSKRDYGCSMTASMGVTEKI